MEGVRPPHFSGKKWGFLLALIYFLISGVPLNAQQATVLKAAPDRVSTALPAKTWDKVRQTLERDGLEGALTAGPDAQTIRIQQKAGLLASGPDIKDQLGISVALSGDTVVVGAYGKNSFSGAAYIFERHLGGGNNWGQARKLAAGDAVRNDLFGVSVAISGDMVVVGAWRKNSAGAAYLFERNTGGLENWGEWGKFIVVDPSPGDQFGFSVAIYRDLALVGLPYRDMKLWNNIGKACLFARNQGGTDRWSWIRTLFDPVSDIEDHVGYSTALGEEFAFVGVPLQSNDKGQDAGAVRVYRRDQDGPNQWGYFKTLTAEDGAAFDQLGFSLALDGDTLVAGGPSEKPGR